MGDHVQSFPVWEWVQLAHKMNVQNNSKPKTATCFLSGSYESLRTPKLFTNSTQESGTSSRVRISISPDSEDPKT